MASTKKNKVGGDKNRNAYIAGGFFIFILLTIAIMWIASIGTKSGNEPKSQMAKITGRQNISTEENKAYNQQLAGYNSRKADEATKAGSSWISIPSYYNIKLDDIKRDQQPNNQQYSQRKNEDTFSQATQPGLKPANQAREEARELLAQLGSSWTYSEPSDAPMRAATSIVPAVAANTALNAAIPAVAPTIAPFRLYEALKICPAKSLVKLDTNTNSAVRATLMCKELSNAAIYAAGYKLVGEDIDMTFSLMTYNGQTYKVTAKPVDLDTGRSMLSADINNNYIRRILIPAVARATQKVGSLYENSSDNTTYVSNGTVVSSSSGKVNTDQVRGTFIGGLAEQTARVLEADNSRVPPVQGTRDQSTFGIMFLVPVMNTDTVDKNSQAVPATPQMPAAQQQRDDQRQELQQSTIPVTNQNPVTPGYGTGSLQIN